MSITMPRGLIGKHSAKPLVTPPKITTVLNLFMKNPLKFRAQVLPKFTPLAALLFFYSSHCGAFGLGELHNHSDLGARLAAQVELLAPPERGTPLAVRLGSRDDYQKNGLSYPDTVKLRFVVSNEAGSPPLIYISSAQAVDEPFLQLLLDVSYPGGRVVKAYTLLLDPPAAPALVIPPVAPLAVLPNIVPVTVARTELAQIAPVKNLPAVVPHRPRVVKPRPAKSRPVQAAATAIKPHVSLQQLDEAHANANATNLTLAMSSELSTGLHISKFEAGAANADVLQEELIAKNKTLHELTLQITEMQALIASLQVQGVSAVSAPITVSALDEMPAALLPAATAAAMSEVARAPVIKTAAASSASSESFAPVLWTLLGVLGAGLFAWVWWRRREPQHDFSRSIFDDLHLAQAQANHLDTPNPFVAKPVEMERRIAETVQIGDVSMKVPAYKAPIQTNNPEYDLLEQADIYLQFGHDKLAEEVLREALIINPKNEQIYLTLLDIYDTRNDMEKFALLAAELEAIADPKIWERVCKMGKRIDPDNELYGLHLTRVAAGEHNTHGGHADKELGDFFSPHLSPPAKH